MQINKFSNNDTDFVEITNSSGMRIVLSSLGASIFSISINNVPMTSHPIEVKDFKRKDIYQGKTIGPISNRIKNGVVLLNNKEYQLDRNEFPNTLHGGDNGYSNQVFDCQIKGNIISYKLNYKGNLPGTSKVEVKYTIEENENAFDIDMSVESNEDTFIAMTNHSYFSLGERNIDNLSLSIPSNKYIETNPNNLIPERILNIIPCLDFNLSKKVMKDINNLYLINHKTKGYDHCFLLDNTRITLESDNYKLDIYTDFPAVHIYSDNYENNAIMENSINLTHRGIAIEPEENLLDIPLLKVGDIYYHKIRYQFIKK